MNLPKIENLGFMGIIALAILAFFYFILGFSGMMSVLGIMLLFIAPMYIILDNFSLSQDEKLVFSFFTGVGIFPAIAYWMGMLISFRLAILVSFAALVAVGILIRRYKK